jgi:pimeloyl-ACP methyl ester carboxylesterase
MSFEHLPPFVCLWVAILALLALVSALAVAAGGKAWWGLRMLLAAALVAGPPAALASLDAVVPTRLDADLRCLLGVYALPGQSSVTITGADGQPRGLRYTFSNGQFGTLQEAANGSYAGATFAIRFEPCSVGTMTLTRGGAAESGQRRRLVEMASTFMSDGVPLHGKLVLPPGGKARALAVWVEGSNNNPSTDDSVWQYELARRGVAVFVYDKRGTGASAGAPLSDFHVRARDTAAAVQEARRLAPRIRHVGVVGGSQGGWVAPLTATLVPLDFVVAAFALADGPIAQDQALVAQQLHEAGFGGAIALEAKALTAITEKIVRSNMREGLAELDAFKTSWAGAPWLAAIQPRSYTGLFLKFSSEQIKTHGPAMAQGLSFDYEPRPVIETIQPRQLWLLGGNDRQAPNAATQAILRQVQQKRRHIAVVVFPKADHGLIEPVTIPSTTATATGTPMAYSAKLFDLTAGWIKHNTLPARGRFVTMPVAR